MKKIRPISIEIRNFLGIEDCKVDFKEGVFLILGQNGAGKSSLLEAIVFALYGTGVRYGRKSPADYLHSGRSDCQVRFCFLRNGKKYEVLRRVKSSGGTEALLIENDSVVATQRSNVDKELQRIFDTSYDSFIATFFLPQGRATYLLTAKRSEINDIVFDILFPKKVLRVVQEKVNELVKNLHAESEKRQARLSDLRDRSDKLSQQVSAEKIAFLNNRLSQLYKEIESKQEAVKVVEQERQLWEQIKQIENTLTTLKAERLKLIEAAEEEKKISLARSLNGEFQILANLREKVDYLQKEKKKSTQQMELYRSGLLQAQGELKKLREKQNELERQLSILYTDRERFHKIELQSEPLINELSQLETAVVFLEREKNELHDSLSQFDRQLTEKQQILQKQGAEIRKLEDEFDSVKEKSLLWMAHEIAQNLQDGDRCPVCGSTFRKIYIDKVEGDARRYQQLKESMEKVQKQIQQAELETKSLLEQKEKTLARANQTEKDLLAKTQKIESIKEQLTKLGFESSLRNKIQDVSMKIEKTLQQRTEIQSKVSKLEELTEQSSKRIEELSKEEHQISSELEQISKNLIEAEKEFHEKLKQIGFTPVEFEIYRAKQPPQEGAVQILQKIELEIERNVEKLSQLREAVKMDFEMCEKEYKKLSIELEQLKKEREENLKQKAVLEHVLQELKVIEEQKLILEKEYKSIDAEYRIAQAVKETLSAREFQSFVTNIVLDEIRVRANDILDTITDGRFKIRVNENGFVITDGGIERDASGLSGGEKTIVSLALAISIAETTAGQMEAFFIDEGFSSLDEENKLRIANALKQMEKLNKVIGFVTHDQQFADYFERKLIVEKGGVVRWQ
ncbi:AAA family ATPase [Pseudothermotoga sp. U03pept]|uniref:AAA family ATPase n=1 Tax=Pseudothermotoga sp. U03pept TaxID=3447012 RepID=UPI003F005F5F